MAVHLRQDAVFSNVCENDKNALHYRQQHSNNGLTLVYISGKLAESCPTFLSFKNVDCTETMGTTVFQKKPMVYVFMMLYLKCVFVQELFQIQLHGS